MMERLELAIGRIRSIAEDKDFLCKPYFDILAKFILQVEDLRLKDKKSYSLEELIDIQSVLYKDIKDEYETSVYCPDYMYAKYGELGRALSVLAVEIRSITFIANKNALEEYVSVLELYLEVYTVVSSDEVDAKKIEDIIYWYASDYLDNSLKKRVEDCFTSRDSFFVDIILNADLSDTRYLFDFGLYVSPAQIKLAEFLAALDDTEIEKMAKAYTSGYKRGFEMAGKDLSSKRYVAIRSYLGFERIIRAAVLQFKEMGLETVIMPKPYRLADKNPDRNIGYDTTGPNKQFEYEHRYDNAILMRKAYIDRKQSITEAVYEELKEELSLYAGPAVLEVFGEEDFEPKNAKWAYSYDDKQSKLFVESRTELAMLMERYVKRAEISFTIIAWPLPGIVEDFGTYKDIFEDIEKVNTLDAELFRDLQQIIIDNLDKASYVHILGGGDNKTDIKVMLHKLNNPTKETNFENCVADVNIPVGEVFTSPLLKGSTGKIHVSKVYIDEYQFKDLEIDFTDGMISNYTCKNFEAEEDNKKLIEEVLLHKHKSLALGEFAIGTNTLAYSIANKHNILRKLPILIVEKTGPHFAIGDTCYSHEEDVMSYNPDGKAIIARENEVSALRHTDMGKAYFNCHTDITIPYDEIAAVIACTDRGEKTYIIKDARFELTGLEKLNEMF